MILPDDYRKCVIFVGYKKSDETYVKLGTAFLVSVPSERENRGFNYIVTAKHIIARISELNLGKVWLRVNTYEGFQWVDSDITHWEPHPEDYNLDVSVAMLLLPREKFDFKTIALENFTTHEVIDDFMIGVGEEIFLMGLFSKHTGTKKNVPIFRTGVISLLADPNELVEVKIMGVRCEIEAHLVEARSIGGLSGSPVFVYLGNFRPSNAKRTEAEIFLLGLMHGHWDVESKPDEYEEDEVSLEKQEKVNMGIAIVIPSTKIVEVINQPKLADFRKQHEERMRQKD